MKLLLPLFEVLSLSFKFTKRVAQMEIQITMNEAECRKCGGHPSAAGMDVVSEMTQQRCEAGCSPEPETSIALMCEPMTEYSRGSRY